MNINVAKRTAQDNAPETARRPLVRIIIVGHVDHGKSTLVGRLLHETGSLPDGKLEMLKEVSARRGMPFEWSFLLDALQTESDQVITIDTTQIRFRTRSRDVVLIWLTTSLNCLTRLLRTSCEDGSLTGMLGVRLEKGLPTPVALPPIAPMVAEAASLLVTMVITPVGERLACRLLAASALFRSFKLLT